MSISLQSHPLIDTNTINGLAAGSSISYRFHSNPAGYLRDHAFQDLPVFPGVAYVDLALSIVSSHQDLPLSLLNVDFDSALLIDTIEQSPPQIAYKNDNGSDQAISFLSGDESSAVYAKLTIQNAGHAERSVLGINSLAEAQQLCVDEVNVGQFYAGLNQRKNQYGPAFRVIRSLHRGDAHACAHIKLGASVDISNYFYHPTLLDGCIQALTATHDSSGRTFFLSKIGRVDVYGRLGRSCWAVASLASESDLAANNITGEINVFSEDSSLALRLTDVEFRYLKIENTFDDKPEQFFAISSTFTSEPVEETLKFWSKELDLKLGTRFAPYNQVFQQLLNPSSEQSQNYAGMNVILLRLEDWLGEPDDSPASSNGTHSTRFDSILQNHERYTLPNGFEIASLNSYETEYVYNEIFVDNAYLKHDVVINDGDTIVDIGANIGLFTLWIQTQAKETTIHAFEPSPPVFEILRTNAELHGHDVHVYNFGVSDSRKKAEFTFYEKSSVFSSFSADEEDDRGAIRAVVENMVRDNVNGSTDQVDAIVDELMNDRLDSKSFTCDLVSLSDMIAEQNIEQIDLLKLDAEKSELEVLRGIRETDWPKIKQIVMEVHDKEGPLIEAVTNLLKSKGFELEIEEETYLQNSGLFNIFASRELGSRTPGAHSNGSHQSLEEVDSAHVYETLSQFTSALKSAAEQRPVPYLVALCPPSAASAENHARLLNELEQKIIQLGQEESNINVIRYQDVLSRYDITNYSDATSDALGNVPYTSEFFVGLGTQLVRSYSAISQAPYKVVVLDCDNTIWAGVVGEDGTDGIQLTHGHKYLQEFMIRLLDAGMLLCLCSKNAESDVLDALEARDDMPIKRNHLVGWRINWQPKSSNLRELAQELNLGLDSFIFLDDNPVECAEVRSTCPEVLTLQVPTTPEEIPGFLDNVWAFDKLGATAEDAQRTQMYQENREREQYRTDTMTLQGFLDGLALDIQIQELDPQYLERVSQLTQRTNQFNFTTVRRSVGEIQQQTQSGDLACLVVHVSDRFGSYGLVGVVMYAADDVSITVDTMLLSCRVLGRGVEHHMLAKVGQIAQEKGLSSVIVPFESTPKNQPAKDFLESVAENYVELNGNQSTYTIPVDVAKEISYQPHKDVEYAEKAMERSVSTKKASPSETSRPARSDIAMRLATELATPEQVLAQMALTPFLPRPDVTTEFVAPANDIEKKIAAIWRDILNLEKVGINDNFFELGGTSLKGVQLIAQLKAQLDVDFTIVSLFEYPTITTMAAVSNGDNRNGHEQASNDSKSRGQNRRAKLRNRRR